MQNWSWSDPGQSPRPPPELTPHPAAPTPSTLRSSSRKNSCKCGSLWMRQLPPGEGRAARAPSGGRDLALAWPYVCLMRFLGFFGTAPFQRSSFGFYNSVVLFVGIIGLPARCFVRMLSLLTFLYKLSRTRIGHRGSPAAVPRGNLILLLHLESQVNPPPRINTQAWV